jgi:hypothetical protein
METGNSLNSGLLVEPGGGFIYRGLQNTVKEHLVNGASLSLSLSMGAIGELGERAHLLGTLKAKSHQYPETGLKTDCGP